MVDEVVPLDQVMTVAKKEVAKWLEVPGRNRQISSIIAKMKKTRLVL